MNKVFDPSPKLFSVVFSALRLLRAQFAAEGRPGLTFLQFRILKSIKFGCHQVGKLACIAQISQPATSKVVDGLVKKGFLRRKEHPHDRRQVELTLSARGDHAVEAIQNRAFNVLGKHFAQLSEDEKASISKGLLVLEKLFDQVENEGRKVN